MPFTHLSCEALKVKLSENPENIVLVDIRDPQSFTLGKIQNAVRIDNSNVERFITDSDFDKELVVYCYHGNSSQGAADYFSQQGFVQCYSLDGGYEAWKLL